MEHPPQVLLVENVVGFETSITRQALKSLLQKNEYHFQEFILSPKDFGTPYSRPRYFCVARKRPFPITKDFDAPWTCTPQVLLQHLARGQDRWEASPQVSFVHQVSSLHCTACTLRQTGITLEHAHVAHVRPGQSVSAAAPHGPDVGHAPVPDEIWHR